VGPPRNRRTVQKLNELEQVRTSLGVYGRSRWERRKPDPLRLRTPTARRGMEKTENFLSANDQQLDEITRLLLQQRDACAEWNSRSIDREDEREMRRLEKNSRFGELYGQMEKLSTNVENLRRTNDETSVSAVLGAQSRLVRVYATI
jgi:hypothetical protein